MSKIKFKCYTCGIKKEKDEWLIKANLRQGKHLFCSHKCSASYIGSLRRGKTHKEIYGLERSQMIQRGNSSKHTKKYLQKIGRKPYWLGKPRSLEDRLKMSKARKLFFQNGGINPMKGKISSRRGIPRSKDVKMKVSKARKQFLQRHPEALKQMILNLRKHPLERRPTKPEMFLNNYIKHKNLPYKYVGTGQFWVTIEGVRINPDFININCKKEFVELLGCYWHGCKQCYSKTDTRVLNSVRKDRLKKRLLKKYKYKLIYIWEHELKNGQFQKLLKES